MTAYYNEHDPKAAAWLRWLIAHDLIAPGTVDERDIREVSPSDLDGYTQHHFFAGIGGWSYAARLAGWPDNRPLWTGSCPCQPFSVAGKRKGRDDARHLWPDFLRLIRAARPALVMGEQVAGAAGRDWFYGVSSDLAGEGYASRAVDIPACAVDAPHIRSRLHWVADAGLLDGRTGPGHAQDGRWPANRHVGMEHAPSIGRGEGQPRPEFRGGRNAAAGADAFDMDDANGAGLALGRGERGDAREERTAAERTDGRDGSFWSDAEWIICHDGNARRAQSGFPMLVTGIPNRVAAWRGFGNAICAPLAAEVIRAYMDAGI